MKIAQIASVAALASVCFALPAVAQAPPVPGAVMIMPGVYTTPEISAKCQQYAIKRVGVSGYTDTSRQAVAAACVRKLMSKQVKGQ